MCSMSIFILLHLCAGYVSPSCREWYDHPRWSDDRKSFVSHKQCTAESMSCHRARKTIHWRSADCCRPCPCAARNYQSCVGSRCRICGSVSCYVCYLEWREMLKCVAYSIKKLSRVCILCYVWPVSKTKINKHLKIELWKVCSAVAYGCAYLC